MSRLPEVITTGRLVLRLPELADVAPLNRAIDASHAELVEAARGVRDALAATAGVGEVDWFVEDERERLSIEVDAAKARLSGVPVEAAVQAAQVALGGGRAGAVRGLATREAREIVAHSHGAALRTTYPHDVTAVAPGATPTVQDYVTDSGEHVVGTAIPLARFGWGLVVEESYDVAFAPVVSVQRRIVAINLSIVVVLGMIMLAGIVVNNAIVLVDYINVLRRRGAEMREAVVTAGTVRLRPILMTTATTSLGLLPMALGLGDGAELRTPMAIAVISGLVVSTLLTLFIIPVIYSLVDRLKARLTGSELVSEAPSVALGELAGTGES